MIEHWGLDKYITGQIKFLFLLRSEFVDEGFYFVQFVFILRGCGKIIPFLTIWNIVTTIIVTRLLILIALYKF